MYYIDIPLPCLRRMRYALRRSAKKEKIPSEVAGVSRFASLLPHRLLRGVNALENATMCPRLLLHPWLWSWHMRPLRKVPVQLADSLFAIVFDDAHHLRLLI